MCAETCTFLFQPDMPPWTTETRRQECDQIWGWGMEKSGVATELSRYQWHAPIYQNSAEEGREVVQI